LLPHLLPRGEKSAETRTKKTVKLLKGMVPAARFELAA